jgi:hypothetical protein
MNSLLLTWKAMNVRGNAGVFGKCMEEGPTKAEFRQMSKYIDKSISLCRGLASRALAALKKNGKITGANSKEEAGTTTCAMFSIKIMVEDRYRGGVYRLETGFETSPGKPPAMHGQYTCLGNGNTSASYSIPGIGDADKTRTIDLGSIKIDIKKKTIAVVFPEGSGREVGTFRLGEIANAIREYCGVIARYEPVIGPSVMQERIV